MTSLKYMGSKRRIVKEILPIMLKDRNGRAFYDLFVGGGNVIEKVDGLRFANDNNEYLIELFKYMQNSEFELPFVGEEMYMEIKNNKGNYPKWLVAYAGFQLSFGSVWFSTYRRDKVGKRDYESEARRNLEKQTHLIRDVSFTCTSYENVEILPNSILYCDIPYKDTTKYPSSKWFDYDKFYDWCRRMSNLGHDVYVSEYSMPDDFQCLWQKEIVSSLTPENNGKKGIEKLFHI